MVSAMPIDTAIVSTPTGRPPNFSINVRSIFLSIESKPILSTSRRLAEYGQSRPLFCCHIQPVQSHEHALEPVCNPWRSPLFFCYFACSVIVYFYAKNLLRERFIIVLSSFHYKAQGDVLPQSGLLTARLKGLFLWLLISVTKILFSKTLRRAFSYYNINPEVLASGKGTSSIVRLSLCISSIKSISFGLKLLSMATISPGRSIAGPEVILR